MSRALGGFTARGWGLLIAAAAMSLCAFLFGFQELYAVGGAAVALVLAARLWVGWHGWDLTIEREAHPSRVVAGGEARVDLEVANRGARRSPPVTAADPFDGGKRWARFAIAPVESGQVRTASYRLPTAKRGVFTLGPLELETTDPFGVARSSRQGGADATVTVHPRFEFLSLHLSPSQSELDSALPIPNAGRAGNEFFTLRPYDVGDDLRRVHWPSSARLDDLMVRQPENRRQTRLVVAVDLRLKIHDESSLEAVLSACASIALSALRDGLQVRVITSAGLDTGFNAGPGEGPIILDALAASERHPGSKLPFVNQLPSSHDAIVLITTDGARDGEIQTALGGAPSRMARVVVFDRRAGRDGEYDPLSETLAVKGASDGRPRTIRLRVGSSLRRAWEAAQW